MASRSRNGYKKQYWLKYYSNNREIILLKKKEYNKLPEVKARSSEYHKNYYLIHKDELNRKHSEYCKNRNNNK